MSQPLITFAVFGFNQERFIRDAIEAAFAQTYRPLEIILSDDCSMDRTFEIMEQMANQYQGPHRVITRRNRANRGFGEHVNQVMASASGAVVVPSAGDDVSLPQRTERIAHHWMSWGQPIGCIFSGAIQTDAKLQPIMRSIPVPSGRAPHIQELIDGDSKSIVGCAPPAWPRGLFDKFGPLGDGIANEDSAIAFRSALIDQFFTIDECLVLHRLHEDNIGSAGIDRIATYDNIREWWHTTTSRRRALVQGMLQDIEAIAAKGDSVHHDLAQLASLCRRVDGQCRDIQDALSLPFLQRKTRLLAAILRSRRLSSASLIFRHLLVPSLWLRLRPVKLMVRRSINGLSLGKPSAADAD